MRVQGIISAVLIVVMLNVMIAGCISNTSDKPQVVTPTPYMPVVAAADLHMKGFDAYIDGKYSMALDLYNQSVTADPKYTRAWIDRGNVLVVLNRTSEAISSYDSALALENTLPLVWISRGEALMTIGNYTGARDSFDKALQIAPANPNAKAGRDLALAKLK
jgi:tetratricopeptide (TPR) repeat protein